MVVSKIFGILTRKLGKISNWTSIFFQMGGSTTNNQEELAQTKTTHGFWFIDDFGGNDF